LTVLSGKQNNLILRFFSFVIL